MDINLEIRNKLFASADEEYREFQSKLMPTVNKETVIGVRTPVLRMLAKELKKNENIDNFLNTLPHQYYEENNLHAFLLGEIKDYAECVCRVTEFLPYINNWATCDMMRPGCFKKYRKELLSEIEKWLSSDSVYAVRYGIEMLMVHFLDDDFDISYLEKVATIKSEEYYINMMIAWYFATALAKQYETTIPYIEKKRLSDWVHNRTIQKAIESYRINEKQKEYLRSLKTNSSTKRR